MPTLPGLSGLRGLSRTRAALALGLVAALATGLAAANCGDSSTNGAGVDSGGPADAAPALPAVCPEEQPAEGAWCPLPEGTTCAYGPCGAFATCTRGVFVRATSPYANLCPSAPPREGSPCGPCFADGGTCVYGDPTCADAEVSPAITTCSAGRFMTQRVECDAGARDAAPVDGGEDDATTDPPDSPTDG